MKRERTGEGAGALRRSTAAAILLFLIFLFLLIRIFAIQVFDFDRYQRKVLDQLTTESPVRAARGKILDSAGRVLAQNRSVYRVSVFPSAAAKCAGSGERIAAGLSSVIEGLTAEKVAEHLSHTSELERTVARNLETEEATRVLQMIREEGLSELVAVEAVNTRYYPYGSLAAQLLGFTGSDGQGLYGLELQYDTLLSGTDGAYVTARDSMGNELPNGYEGYVAATDGCTLHTTIDAFIEAALESQLEATLTESAAANRVAGIVMDVNTGAILGMATAPSFDLNDPFSLDEAGEKELAASGYAAGSDEYRALRGQLLAEMWSNKAVTEIYMPGSTFKTLTCSMALEENVVTNLDERFFCSGALQVADRTIHCHKKGGHGSLTFREGLQKSCNPVMMTIAARLGCDTFYDYVRAFGMLEKTGVDLPGEGNSIFHAASSFTELDLATASFGQNFKVSMMQMITAVGAIANGGELLTPYLLESAEDVDGNVIYTHEKTVRRRVISEETANTISAILAEGVAGDGGAKNAYVAGYRIAAKTGTSEKIGDDRNARIGSCVAYAPADDPRVAVIIVVDEPTDGSRFGSVVAAPYVANVMEAILPYLGVEPVYTEVEKAARTMRVPDLVGKSVTDAAALLFEAGIGYRTEGEGYLVTGQLPEAGGTFLANGASVVLLLGNSEATLTTVPDIVGMSAVAANRALVDRFLNVSVQGARDFDRGTQRVSAQIPAAGTQVPRGTVVIMRFSYEETSD